MNTFLSTSRYKQLGILALMMFGMTVAGCGGGGDDSDVGGSINQQAITVADEQDAENSSVAARESARQAIIDEESSGGAVPFGVSLNEVSLEDKVSDLSQLLILQELVPEAYTNSTPGDCGGSQEVTVSDNGSGGTIKYNNFCMTIDGAGNTSVINGRVDVDFGNNSNFTQYTTTYDYTITYLGETYRYRGSQSCVDANCTTSTDFTAEGRTYRSENVQVENTGSGYSVSGRVYDGDRGYVDYQATDLVLCSSGGFQSGSISITDSTGAAVVQVTFSSCDSYTITYGGVSNTYSY